MFKVFQPFETLEAEEVNDYLMEQAVPVFANATERGQLWPAPHEGALSVVLDPAATLHQFRGGAWTGITVTNIFFDSTFSLHKAGVGNVIDHNAGGMAIDALIGNLYLRSSGAIYMDSDPLQQTYANPGNDWTQRTHVMSGVGGGLVGIALNQSGMGAICTHLYTSAQSGVGFHMVNAPNTAMVTITALAYNSLLRMDQVEGVGELSTVDPLEVVKEMRAVTYTPIRLDPPEIPLDLGTPPLPPEEVPEPIVVAPQPEPGQCIGWDGAALRAIPGMPEGVVGEEDAVDLGALVAVLVEAVKALTARVEALGG